MAEIPDRRSFVGRIGALSVVGELPLLGRQFSARAFEGMKLAWTQTQYRDLADLTELYALRWSVVRFPDSNRDSLIFETVFHGDWEQYLTKLIRKTAIGIDLHAKSIRSYPGTADVETFLSFLVRHHQPALHVFAANPMMSPVDIDQFMPEEGADGAPKPADGRWFGFIVALRPGRSGTVRDLFADWSWSSSPFNAPAIQHGRALIVERGSHSYLLVSVVYTSDPIASGINRRRAATDRADRQLVEVFVGERGDQWRQVLRQTTASAGTRADLIGSMMANRYGHGADGSICWVDWCWSFPPDLQRAFWSSERPRPHLLPAERSRRPASAPR